MSSENPTETLARLAREAHRNDLVYLSCGNASLREGDKMFITCSGSELGCLKTGEISVVGLQDGRHLTGPSPSIEYAMHRAAYLARPELGAVLHTHARYSTVLGCSPSRPKDLNFVPEIPLKVGGHAYVDYERPGTEKLARRVRMALLTPGVNVVQLCNHGQLVVGKNWQEALNRAVYFERACWLALNIEGGKTIPSLAVAELLEPPPHVS